MILLFFAGWTKVSFSKTAENHRVIKPSDWIIIGPFENTKGKGFDTVYPPEKEIQLDAFYFGKLGRKVNWQRLYWMDGEIGERFVLSRLFPQKNSVAYAFTTIYFPKKSKLSFRIESEGPLKVWLNEKQILVYYQKKHSVIKVPVELEKGWNQILVKSAGSKGEWGFVFGISSEKESLADFVCAVPKRTYGANKAALFSSLVPGPGHIYLGEKDQGLLLLGGEFALLLSSFAFDRDVFSGLSSSEESTFLSNPGLIGATELPYLSVYLAYREARDKNHNIGYKHPLSNDSLKDLAKAPYDLKLITEPDFFLPLFSHLGGILTIMILLDEYGESIGNFGMQRDTVRVYNKKLPPLLGYPLGEAGMMLSFTAVAMGEEALFRGYIQSELEERFGRKWGWITASTLFGAMHLPKGDTTKEHLAAFLSTLTGGLIMGHFYQENYSLRKPIAYHTWWNLLLGTLDLILNPEDSMISGSISLRF